MKSGNLWKICCRTSKIQAGKTFVSGSFRILQPPGVRLFRKGTDLQSQTGFEQI